MSRRRLIPRALQAQVAVMLLTAAPAHSQDGQGSAASGTAVSGSAASGTAVQASHIPTAARPAARADAAQSAAAPSQSTEQITVTAEHRAQSAQSLGSSVSVLSGRTLADRNVNNVFDLQYQVPSLQVTPQFGSGQLEFSIRGVGFEDYASNNAPTVGLYVDEVAFPVPFETNGAIFDVQRVEVLRGPQGTLYGRNTTGGLINYVLNKPTTDFQGGLAVQYGSFNATKVDGYLSGPITSNLQYRIAGETQKGGAWQLGQDGDLLGNADRTSLRTLLDWQPTDTLRVELNLHGSRDRSDALGTHLYAPNTALALLGEGSVVPAATDRDSAVWGTSPAFARLIGIQPDAKPFSHIDTAGTSLRADQQVPVGTLTDLISYDYAKRSEYDNFDASSQALADVAFDTRANVFANELRLTSNGNSRLTYVGGIYYSNQYLDDAYYGGFDQIYGVDTATRYSQKVDTISGFGQLGYRLARSLTLTGGLRIEHEERRLQNFSSFYVTPAGAIENPNNSVGRQATQYTLPSGKVELQYHPFQNDMIYAEASRGIKSGGFTTYVTTSPKIGTAPFRPETLWAFEVGNKLTIPEAHLRVNVSGFYYDYHNQQIQSAVVNPATGLIGSIINAPRSHIIGGEVEVVWTPLRHLTLAQSVSEAYGRFDEFRSVESAVYRNGSFVGVYANRDGESLPAPKFTANGSISYDLQLNPYVVAFEGDYSLRTTYNSLFGPLYNVAGYTLFNAHVTLSPQNRKWSLTAFGENILDKRYDIDRNFFDTGDDIATAGLPGTWGVRASVNF